MAASMMRHELQMPPPLWKLLRGFETNCTADCCQLRAFDLERHRLEGWVMSWGPEAATAAIESLAQLLDDLDALADEQRVYLPRVEFRGTCADLRVGLRDWLALLRRVFTQDLRSVPAPA